MMTILASTLTKRREKMNWERRSKIIVRWAIVTAGATALFWFIWSRVAEVPVTTVIRITPSYILPTSISRWWDVLAAPIWSTIFILLFTCSSLEEAFLLLGLATGLVLGLLLGPKFGLELGLLSGWGFGFGFGLCFEEDLELALELRSFPDSELFTISLALVFGLAASGLGFGLLSGLTLGLIFGLAFMLAFALSFGIGCGLFFITRAIWPSISIG